MEPRLPMHPSQLRPGLFQLDRRKANQSRRSFISEINRRSNDIAVTSFILSGAPVTCKSLCNMKLLQYQCLGHHPRTNRWCKRSMALMTYLLKDRHGTYYFRRVIPPDLRPFMPPRWQHKANFKQSLRTKKPSVAKIEASKVLRECTVASSGPSHERRRAGRGKNSRRYSSYLHRRHRLT